MTTRATVPDQRRWWQYAGPWPLFPVADGLVSALVALSVRSFLITPATVPLEIFTAALFGFIIFAILYLARRFLPLEANYPALGRWLARIESLPGYDRTVPPQWRIADQRGSRTKSS